jgi:UDP-glucose:(heptosyl)LPS alpha-1,3-glucosyltransferase
LRLAVVSPFVDRRHGTERALAELVERLARDHDCEVHLYAQSVEDLSVAATAAPSALPGAVIWHKVPSIPGPHLVQFLAWMLLNGFLRKWRRVVRRTSYDVVLSPGINCLRPDVVIVHAIFHRLGELSREESALVVARASPLRRLHRNLYYRVLMGLERKVYTNQRVSLAAVSQRTAGLLQKYFQRTDVRVIPNAVDTSHFSAPARLAKRAQARLRWQLRDEELVLLLIGNDWNTKGLATLMQSIAALQNLPLRLLVVGSDAPKPFQAFAARLGVEEHCVWEGPRADVLDFYAAADVYVSPSREDSFGLPVAEAMACGLPVITSSFAGVAENIEDGVTGFVLQDPRDVSKLAELIYQLETNADLRSNLGEAAARKALELTWDAHANGVRELLRDSMAKRSATYSPQAS